MVAVIVLPRPRCLNRAKLLSMRKPRCELYAQTAIHERVDIQSGGCSTGLLWYSDVTIQQPSARSVVRFVQSNSNKAILMISFVSQEPPLHVVFRLPCGLVAVLCDIHWLTTGKQRFQQLPNPSTHSLRLSLYQSQRAMSRLHLNNTPDPHHPCHLIIDQRPMILLPCPYKVPNNAQYDNSTRNHNTIVHRARSHRCLRRPH